MTALRKAQLKFLFARNRLTAEDDTEHTRLVVPIPLRREVLLAAHDFSGHLGIRKLRAMIGKHFTWPGLYRDIVQHYSSCPTCQRVNKTSPTPAPCQSVPILTIPWENIALDIVGPFPSSKEGFKYILTAICLASKFPFAVPQGHDN